MVGLLDMVKVLSFALSEGKVAVHCHAGLGRTGWCTKLRISNMEKKNHSHIFFREFTLRARKFKKVQAKNLVKSNQSKKNFFS